MIIRKAENGFTVEYNDQLFVLKNLDEVHIFIDKQWGRITDSPEDIARRFEIGKKG